MIKLTVRKDEAILKPGMLRSRYKCVHETRSVFVDASSNAFDRYAKHGVDHRPLKKDRYTENLCLGFDLEQLLSLSFHPLKR